MATTFSTAKVALDEIASRIQANRQRLTQAKATTTTAKNDLAAMPAAYGTVVSDIDAAAQSAPSDVALQNLKAEKDKLVAEFTALQTTATSMETALNGITI